MLGKANLTIRIPMPNPRPNTKGLIDTSASDITTASTPKTIRIEIEDLEWLGTLEGTPAFHVRQAIRQYRKNFHEILDDSMNTPI
jgi:hypothetical protein